MNSTGMTTKLDHGCHQESRCILRKEAVNSAEQRMEKPLYSVRAIKIVMVTSQGEYPTVGRTAVGEVSKQVVSTRSRNRRRNRATMTRRDATFPEVRHKSLTE